MSSVIAIVGLGNPGSNYSSTRHNLGFWVVDEFVKRLESGKQGIKQTTKFDCQFVRSEVSGTDVLFVKPLGFMNRSGVTLTPFLRFFKISRDDLVIIHDELDLPSGRIRIKRGGSSGGHNGVEDIISSLGSPDFLRIRVGIGHPRDEFPMETGRPPVTDWVLGKPRPEEQKLLEKAVSSCCDVISALIEKGLTTQGVATVKQQLGSNSLTDKFSKL